MNFESFGYLDSKKETKSLVEQTEPIQEYIQPISSERIAHEINLINSIEESFIFGKDHFDVKKEYLKTEKFLSNWLQLSPPPLIEGLIKSLKISLRENTHESWDYDLDYNNDDFYLAEGPYSNINTPTIETKKEIEQKVSSDTLYSKYRINNNFDTYISVSRDYVFAESKGDASKSCLIRKSDIPLEKKTEVPEYVFEKIDQIFDYDPYDPPTYEPVYNDKKSKKISIVNGEWVEKEISPKDVNYWMLSKYPTRAELLKNNIQEDSFDYDSVDKDYESVCMTNLILLDRAVSLFLQEGIDFSRLTDYIDESSFFNLKKLLDELEKIKRKAIDNYAKEHGDRFIVYDEIFTTPEYNAKEQEVLAAFNDNLGLLDLSNWNFSSNLYEDSRMSVPEYSYETILNTNKDVIMVTRSIHDPKTSKFLNDKFNIHLEDLYLDEQVQFLDYLSGTKTENWNQLESVLKNPDIKNENVLRSFLSLDAGGAEMGQKILELAEKLPPESANAIFSKYTEIIDITKDIENFVANQFGTNIIKQEEVVKKVQEKLIDRSIGLLNIFHQKIKLISGSNISEVTKLIQVALDKISANALATLSTFKYAREHGFDLKLEDIAESEFKHQEAAVFSDSDKEEMVQIYHENYEKNPELAENLINKFVKAFDNPEGNELYTYRINRELQAFVRFEQYKDGKYASALNVAKDSHGFALGEAMMSQALTKEAYDNILYAEADISGAVCSRYLAMGFVGTAPIDSYPGVPAIEIVWDNHNNTEYISRNFIREKVIAGEYQNSSDIEILVLDTVDEFDRSVLGDMVMTHSFFDKETNKHYIVLEKKKETQVIKENKNQV